MGVGRSIAIDGRNEYIMPTLPDLETLRLCSMLGSCAFATMFLAFWINIRRQNYLLHWAASAALYAGVLEGFALIDRHDRMAVMLLFGLLAVTDVLILTGVASFDRRLRLGRREIGIAASALAIPVLSASGVMRAILPAAIAADSVMIGLASSKIIVGCWLLVRRGEDIPLAQRFVGAAMLGYVPAYVIVIVARHQGLGGPDLGAIVPMLADQLLLSALNIALMAMPAERATRELRVIR
jgi:hypothetical protein